jgi:arylsulfatase A-like enzyme
MPMKGCEKKFRIIIKALSLCAIALLVSCGTDKDERKLESYFKELGFSINKIGSFRVKQSLLREGKENTFWTIFAEKNGQVVKIEVVNNMDGQSASSYIKDREYAILSLYQHIPSAYPGMISHTEESSDEYKPKIHIVEIEGKKTPVYLLYSTARFTYGVSVDDLIVYRGALTFVYNAKEKILYRLDLFIPKEKFNQPEVLNWLSALRFIGLSKVGQEKKSVLAKKKNSALTESKKSISPHSDLGDYKDYNLIVIGFEPLGARHVSIYGYHKQTTPNIDRFAQGAYLFQNAISPSSWTLPVFMSWFTSLYPSQHKLVNKYSTYTDEEQILSNLSKLSPTVITLAQVLKKEGYATAGFTGGAALSGDFGYRLGFDVYFDETTFGGFDIVLPKAIKWLKANRKKKFFLFIQGYDVHGRYALPDDYANNFSAQSYTGKYKGSVEEYWALRNLSLDKGELEMDDTDVDFWKSIYDAKIYEADKKFGFFLDELDKLGLSDKTIIVLSSGSGNEYYEHHRFDHGFSLYDELIHVPFIIKLPGKDGDRIESQVRTIDLMPTVLILLNINYGQMIANQMQGDSLIPFFQGQTRQLEAYSETDYLLQVFKRSLRTPDGWKYIYSLDNDRRELYNLKSDPQELKNLARTEKRIAYELEQKLFKHLKSIGRENFR